MFLTTAGGFVSLSKSALHISKSQLQETVPSHMSVDMCSTCLSGRKRHWCHVIWTAATAPRQPTEMSVIPRGFLFMSVFEQKIKWGSSVSHSWEWKMLTDTSLCIPSGTTPPPPTPTHVDHISPLSDRLPQVFANFSTSNTESCSITTNPNKLSTNCSVGRTANGCKPPFFMVRLVLLEIHFMDVNMLYCFTPTRLDG